LSGGDASARRRARAATATTTDDDDAGDAYARMFTTSTPRTLELARGVARRRVRVVARRCPQPWRVRRGETRAPERE
jgi:hypothetical protein